MTDETKRLLSWQLEWFIRFWRTTWHLLNRKAYRRWLSGKYFINGSGFTILDEMDFH